MGAIAFIPAFNGGLSCPEKCLQTMAGRPLIWWSLSSLQSARNIDKIVVAIDDPEATQTIKSFQFSKVEFFTLPIEKSKSSYDLENLIAQYLNASQLQSEQVFVLVQILNPLTQSDDFDSSFKKFCDTNCDSLFSGLRTKSSLWSADGTRINFDIKSPREEPSDSYIETGEFYISHIGGLREHKNILFGSIGIYELPDRLGATIDDPVHFKYIENQIVKERYSEIMPSAPIRLFLTDIDGVLTDAGMYYTESGDEFKKFNTYDGVAIEFLKGQGIPVGFITKENRELNRRRAEKLKIDYLYSSENDKLSRAKELCEKLKIPMESVAYIGDDIGDYELLQNVGYKACPQSAQKIIKSIPGIFILNGRGGSGVVREWVSVLQEAGRLTGVNR